MNKITTRIFGKQINMGVLIIMFLVFFPSFSAIQKLGIKLGHFLKLNNLLVNYGSFLLIVLYTLSGGYILLRAKKIAYSSDFSAFKSRFSMIATIILVALLFILFSIIYPYATSGAFGVGSDRDEALNIAVTSLLEGKYPYYEKTYVPGRPHELGGDGNPISPLPGELLISIPFVAMGNGAYQIFFWILCTAIIINHVTKNSTLTFITTFSACFLSIGSIYEIVSGGDLLVNCIWVFSAFLCLTYLRNEHNLLIYFVAIFMGITFSSRPNFILIAPFAIGLCAIKFRPLKVIKFSSIVAFSFLSVTLPFYFYDTTSFSPLHAYSKIGRFDINFPYIGIFVPLFSFFLSLFLTYKLYKGKSHLSYWFMCMSIILFIPVFIA